MKNPIEASARYFSKTRTQSEPSATGLPMSVLLQLQEHLTEANQLLRGLISEEQMAPAAPVEASVEQNRRFADATPHLTVARSYEGLDEEKDTAQLERFLGVNPAATPWCGAFVKSCLRDAGLQTLNTNRARDFASYGTAGDGSVGDIAVWGSHVAIVAETTPDVKVIGGNQSNEVNTSPKHWYDRYSKFIGYRRPVS